MAEKHTASGVFPQFPGEDFLAHAGTQYKEQAEARLASRSLLAVAQGDYPPSVKSIVDVDLDSLPELPVGHRDYTRRQETRIKIQTQNAANAEKRYDLLMTAWTEVYTLLKESTETTAPVLSRQLRMSCDLLANRNITGGYFDGPQAWRIVLHKLDNAHRSETDKDFYRSAERLQRASPLADGSPATDYSKRALAFLIHIRPHLPQSYDDDDTAQYLIRLMPKSLREGGRRITRELTDEGRLHDFMHVIQRCRELVQEEQKAAAAVPAFVVAPEDLGTHDLQLMERSTGMMLALPGQVSMAGTTNPPVAFISNDGTAKWCTNCPHTRKDGSTTACFQDPGYAGPPPLNVFANKERWQGIKLGREANSKKSGKPCVTLHEPSKAEVEKYRKEQKEKKAKWQAKKKGEQPPVGTPAGVAAAPVDLDAWRESLLDISLVGVEWNEDQRTFFDELMMDSGAHRTELSADLMCVAVDEDGEADGPETEEGSDEVPQHCSIRLLG